MFYSLLVHSTDLVNVLLHHLMLPWDKMTTWSTMMLMLIPKNTTTSFNTTGKNHAQITYTFMTLTKYD